MKASNLPVIAPSMKARIDYSSNKRRMMFFYFYIKLIILLNFS